MIKDVSSAIPFRVAENIWQQLFQKYIHKLVKNQYFLVLFISNVRLGSCIDGYSRHERPFF
jgi:hypothetical protein